MKLLITVVLTLPNYRLYEDGGLVHLVHHCILSTCIL